MEELKKVKTNIPKWATTIYILISIGMIPWVIYLGISLHAQHISRNWSITWVGLDIAQISLLLITGLLTRLNSIYMIFTAAITGTLFLTDASSDHYYWLVIFLSYLNGLNHRVYILYF